MPTNSPLLNSVFSRILRSTSSNSPFLSPYLQTMSISTKIPHPLLNHPYSPSLKPLKFSSLHSPLSRLTFFRSITIQSISTKSNLAPNSTSQSSLQPLEELPPKLQEIIKLFQAVEQPKAKYEQLLFYGKNLTPLENKYKTNENKVQGCVSQVWVRAYFDNLDKKNVTFEADSDSVLTKGLAALLVQGLSGRPVEEIVRVSPDFVTLLGLQQSLTPSRNNGFLNMLKLMQKKALQLYVDTEKAGNIGEGESSNASSEGEGSWDGVNGNGNVENGTSSEVSGNDASGGDVVLRSRGMRIKEKLEKELKPVELEVEDISYQHAGHAAIRGSGDGETHFNLKVVSKEFEGKSLVKRHRMIYDLLQDELQNGLHALSIVAKTQAEVGSS